MLVWRKLPTEPTKKYYYTIQNTSIIPRSKVHIYVTNTEINGTQPTGYLTLTAKNVHTSVLPTGSYIYVADSDGGIVGSALAEVVNVTNFDIEVVHEDVTLSNTSKRITVPRGGLFTLQNKADNNISFKIGSRDGNGELTTRQIFSIAMAKDTVVTVSGRSGSVFTYIITPSVNMTYLDDGILNKLSYIMSNIEAINSGGFIKRPDLDHIYPLIKQGLHCEKLTLTPSSNITEITFPHVKVNPNDRETAVLPNNDLYEVYFGLNLTIGGELRECNGFISMSENNDKGVHEFYCSNELVEDIIKSAVLEVSNDRKKVRTKLVFSTQVDSVNGFFYIRNDHTKLEKDTESFTTGSSTTYNINGSRAKYHPDTIIQETAKNFVPNYEKLRRVELLKWKLGSADLGTKTFALLYKSNSSKAIKVEYVPSADDAAIKIHLNTSSYVAYDNIGKLHALFIQGNQLNSSQVINFDIISKLNTDQVKEQNQDGYETVFTIKLHKSSIDGYRYIEKWFEKTIGMMNALSSGTENDIDSSSIVLMYEHE